MLLRRGGILAFDNEMGLVPDAVHVAFFDQESLEDIVLAPDDVGFPFAFLDGMNRRQRGKLHCDAFHRAGQHVFIGMSQQNDRLLRMVHDAVGKTGLIVEDQGDAVLTGNVFGRGDNKLSPVDRRIEGDARDAARVNSWRMVAPKSISGRRMSSMYWAAPVTLSRPSLRGTELPTMAGCGAVKGLCSSLTLRVCIFAAAGSGRKRAVAENTFSAKIRRQHSPIQCLAKVGRHGVAEVELRLADLHFRLRVKDGKIGIQTCGEPPLGFLKARKLRRRSAIQRATSVREKPRCRASVHTTGSRQ